MARVTCPDCETRTRVPDDHDRSYVRCKECDKKIYLDEEEVEEKPRRVPRTRTLGRVTRPGRNASDFGSGLLSFWPLLLIFPLALMPCLASMHRVGGFIGICVGIFMAIVGFIMAWVAASRAGIGTVGDLPFILQRIPLVHLFYQIKYAIELPKEAGMWVFLEFMGIGVAIVSGILMSGHDMAPDRFAQRPFPNPQNNMQFIQDGNGEIFPPGMPLPAQITGDFVIDQALAELQNPDDNLARAGADKLSQMKPDAHQMVVAERLVAEAHRPDGGVQVSVARALGVWGTMNEVPAMVQILDDVKSPARNQAFDFLARFDDPRAVGPMVRYFRDHPQPNVRDAIRKLGPSAEKDLVPLLTDKSLITKRETIKLLREVGSQESIPALQMIANGTNGSLRSAALDAINNIQLRGKK